MVIAAACKEVMPPMLDFVKQAGISLLKWLILPRGSSGFQKYFSCEPTTLCPHHINLYISTPSNGTEYNDLTANPVQGSLKC